MTTATLSATELRRIDALWRASITAPTSASDYVIDYYIEVLGIAGNAITRVGGPEMPLGLSVSPGRAPPR